MSDFRDSRSSIEEAKKSRIQQLKKLGDLDDAPYDSLPQTSLIRTAVDSIRHSGTPERPTEDHIRQLADRWQHELPRHEMGQNWSGTLEDVLGEVLRVAADDFDGTVPLPEEYNNPMGKEVAGYVFEAYKSWTTDDFVMLFQALGKEFPLNDLNTIREASQTRQEKQPYDEEKDLETIMKYNGPLTYRGYALERLIKKIQQEPTYIQQVEQKFASAVPPKDDSRAESDIERNWRLEQEAHLKIVLDFIKQKVG